MKRRTPAWIIAPAVVGLVLLITPIIGLLHRAPWSSLSSLLSSEAVTDAIALSLVVSLSATALSIVLGTPLAWLLARRDFAGQWLVRALVLLPMVLPPVVGGTALLFALGRRGFVGRWLDDWFGLTLPFSTTGAVIAATFVSMPFYVITAEAAIAGADLRREEAARTLGASPWTVFRRVTIPTARPALLAGTALAWARALGEFGATVTFAGNLPGRTQTLPLATFVALESDPDRALALALLLLTISLAILVALRGRWLTP